MRRRGQRDPDRRTAAAWTHGLGRASSTLGGLGLGGLGLARSARGGLRSHDRSVPQDLGAAGVLGLGLAHRGRSVRGPAPQRARSGSGRGRTGWAAFGGHQTSPRPAAFFFALWAAAFFWSAFFSAALFFASAAFLAAAFALAAFALAAF